MTFKQNLEQALYDEGNRGVLLKALKKAVDAVPVKVTG